MDASPERIVILHFNYEELAALKSGARLVLDSEDEGASYVVAPTETRAQVEALVPRLGGDISLATLHDLRIVESAVGAIVESLRVEMESTVVTTHAADEGAVAAYFDFAHGLAVAHRLGAMAAEMTAMIEVVTGAAPTPEVARTFHFPD